MKVMYVLYKIHKKNLQNYVYRQKFNLSVKIAVEEVGRHEQRYI